MMIRQWLKKFRGISLGATGSAVELETADNTLMADKLNNLHFAIGLSKKAHSIIILNLIISLGVVIVWIRLTVLGIAADIRSAAIRHEGATLVVVFNALQLLVYKSLDDWHYW